MTFGDDRFPRPSIQSFRPQPHAATCVSFTYSWADGGIGVAIVDNSSRTPKMWFVDSGKASSEFRTIVCFADGRFPAGSVVSPSDAESAGASSSEGCGFIRWNSSTNEIQQIAVAHEYRRMGISRHLISVADILIVADVDWNGKFMTGGSITTTDGEHLRQAWERAGSTRLLGRVGSYEQVSE